jgi:DNA-binding response OmpR family regulator
MAKILLLEDNPVIRKIAASILRKHSYEVLEASSTEESRQKTYEDVNVIVCDEEFLAHDSECIAAYTHKSQNIPILVVTDKQSLNHNFLKISKASLHDRLLPEVSKAVQASTK